MATKAPAKKAAGRGRSNPDAARDERPSGPVMQATAADPNATPQAYEPAGDLRTSAEDAVGREFVMTRCTINKSTDPSYQQDRYAVLSGYFADDRKREARFIPCGATLIVRSIEDIITKGERLPLRLTIVGSRAKGYHFQRKGERIR